MNNMDPNLLKNLGLDGKMNQNDINLLNQILNSTVGNNKTPKMTVKDRNNLINKLSGSNTLSEIPDKDIKDMNDEEKKIYREELKKKLKNKQNEKKMLRTNNLSKDKTNYGSTLNKISNMMQNIDTNQFNLQNTSESTTQQNLSDKQTNSIDKNSLVLEKLINNNSNNNESINSELIHNDIKNDDKLHDSEEFENLEDFIN